MTIQVALLISIVSVSFSIYFGLKNAKRTDAKEIEKRVAENTTINIKLDNIANLTEETRKEVSTLRTSLEGHNERIIKLEESCKSAHHRIDGIEQRIE